ncbi:MAG: peptide-binding protein [Burkholderiales bacterium]|nr:MAG: peptide-binding protein [Burkholderiales bacterium]
MTGIRRLQGLLFALLLLLLIPAVQAREMVSVARDEINMRSGPGTGHAITWQLSRGYPLQVVGRKGQWLRVRDFENDEGWVFRSLTNKTPHYVVRSKIVNIRSAPGTHGRIVGKAGYGEVLRTLARRGDWVRIRQESGATGWVARRLLWGW